MFHANLQCVDLSLSLARLSLVVLISSLENKMEQTMHVRQISDSMVSRKLTFPFKFNLSSDLIQN